MRGSQHSGRRREDTGHTSLALYRLGAQFVIPLLPGHNYPMTGRDITLGGGYYPGSGRHQVPGAGPFIQCINFQISLFVRTIYFQCSIVHCSNDLQIYSTMC